MRSLRRGDPAPADGRWISEPSFALLWRRLGSLEDTLEDVEGELELERSRAAELSSLLRLERSEHERARLQLSIETHNKGALQRRVDDSFENSTVWLLIGGSAAGGVLVGLLIAASIN